MQCFDIAKFVFEWQTGGRLNAKLAMRRILLRGIELVANILGVVKNCRPLANSSNCKVWEEGISEDFHTTCKLARMTLRVIPLRVRFYIAIEDGSAQLKRDLGEPHTKVEFGPLGQRKATLLANSVWSSLRHLQNEPSRRASRVQKRPQRTRSWQGGPRALGQSKKG